MLGERGGVAHVVEDFKILSVGGEPEFCEEREVVGREAVEGV